VISVEEALKRILDFVDVLGDEEKPLLGCLGQVLAKDVYAPFDVPQQDNSAMDGYAAQVGSIQGASHERPKVLRIVGEIVAGSTTGVKIEPGTCARIMTGAYLPQGADVVVPFEATDEVEGKRASTSKTEISVRSSLPEGANIRRSGEDVAEGELVLKRGTVLGPAELGVLASLGNSGIAVVRRPVVGVLATGDEVLDISQPMLPGKIYNSNTYSLAAQILAYGGVPRLLGIAADNIRQLSVALRRGFDCDMLITSGGVSLGDYDVVREALVAQGDIFFWKVRMKPGKPLAFGAFKGDNGRKIPHLGLPGNPVSSMITFELFARPAIAKMMGKESLARPSITAIMDDSIKNSDGRRIFARVVVSRREGKYYASLAGAQGSGVLTSMVKANGLAIVPETTEQVNPGTTVEVMMLDWESNGVR